LRDCRGFAVQNEKVSENLWFLNLQLEGEFEVPEPGQFVQLRTGASTDPLLRRPFSVASFRAGMSPTLGIIYAPIGKWTKLVASKGTGFEVDVLGPLGNAYAIGREEKCLLVAGGRGVAPLLYLARKLNDTGRSFLSLVGARSEHDLYWSEDLTGPCDVKVVTEDGSAGAKGLVTDLLEAELPRGDCSAAVYACGPLAMLRKVAEICSRAKMPCQVSVETSFACGFGVCRGCVVPSAAQGVSHLMACSDGPVLRASDVDWERFVE
jgi:dihydroorotate dehydrogenase electron transfer subunit